MGWISAHLFEFVISVSTSEKRTVEKRSNMSHSKKDPTKLVLASLKAALVHVTNIQHAISKGRDRAPAEKDLQALKGFIHSEHWHHESGSNAR